MSQRVSRDEWIWVAVASTILVLVFSAPYLIGLLRPVEGQVFGGLTTGIADMNSYLAKMRVGAQGLWLYEVPYTHEAQRGAFFFFHYMLLGKLVALISGEGARVSGQALVTGFHAARIAGSYVLLAVLYRFAAQYLDQVPGRRLAWVMASALGGLGWIRWLALTLAGTADFIDLPVEIVSPDTHTLLNLYTIPHLLFARALMLAGWLLMLRSLESQDWRPALGAALCWAGMAAIQVIYAGVVGALGLAWLAAQWWIEKRLPWRAGIRMAAALVLPSLYVVYAFWQFQSNPILAAWGAQTGLDRLPVIHYVLAYGLQILAAVPALLRWRRRGLNRESALLLLWPLVAFLLVTTPFAAQRRLLEAVIVPISILAADGMLILVGEGGEQPDLGWRLRWLGLAAAVMMLTPSTAMLLLGGLGAVTRAERPIYYSVEEIAALDYLRLHAAPGDIVVSSAESGNLIAAYASVRTYLGLATETYHFSEKQTRTERLYSGERTDEAAALLVDIGADYVWYGPLEAELATGAGAGFDPEALGLTVVFTSGAFVVYEVQP